MFLVFSILFTGCVKMYDIQTQSVGDIDTQVWFQTASNGETILLEVNNKSNTTMYIDWSSASFTYPMINNSGELIDDTVPVKVLSVQEGLSKPIQITTYSLIRPNSSKSSVYTLIPKMEFTSSGYLGDSNSYIFDLTTLKEQQPFLVNFAVCSGELQKGVMPVECASGSSSWRTVSVKGRVSLVPTSR